MCLAFGLLFPQIRRWRGIGNLGDEKSSRGFCDAVDEDAQEGDLEEAVKADSEAEEDSFALAEPGLLLLRGVMNT